MYFIRLIPKGESYVYAGDILPWNETLFPFLLIGNNADGTSAYQAQDVTNLSLIFHPKAVHSDVSQVNLYLPKYIVGRKKVIKLQGEMAPFSERILFPFPFPMNVIVSAVCWAGNALLKQFLLHKLLCIWLLHCKSVATKSGYLGITQGEIWPDENGSCLPACIATCEKGFYYLFKTCLNPPFSETTILKILKCHS